ncbi:hypothetical protein [Paracidovorax wautersii]|uniref:hypothetical protein n=1 Tax=Paracidovorax wautersii TaxID=1177982 RepID=UPI0031D8EF9F
MTAFSYSSTALPPRFGKSLMSASMLALLAACGGGGGGDPSPSSPAAIALSGTVVADQALSNVLVCADLNGNQACDANEPKAAAATGADGRYALTYQPADDAAASAFRAAPLLAQVGNDAVDAAEPQATATTRAFVLSTPAGKSGGQISPLTTLVQKAVAGGLPLADAEAAVAQQLAVPVAKLYDYQGDARSADAVLPDTARTAAKLTAFALEMGGVLNTVAVNATAAASSSQGSLTYTDAQNWRLAVRDSDGTVDANGNNAQFERRSGMAAGATLSAAQLYPTPASVTLTDTGWDRCDGTPPRLNTRGSPSRTRYCDGATRFYSVTVAEQDVSGKSMADVAAQMQAGNSQLSGNGFQQTATLTMASVAPLGNATFPAGSLLRTNVSAQLNQAITINNTATDLLAGGAFSTLEALIAGRPASAVNLATAGGTLPLGIQDDTHSLRAAFVDGSTLQIYRCNATAPNYSDSNNCTALSQNAYSIDLSGGGVRLLRIANFPLTSLNQLRGYTEYNGGVYQYRQPRPATKEEQVLSYTVRLNNAGWAAFRTRLGL